jgi:hypothetical protein
MELTAAGIGATATVVSAISTVAGLIIRDAFAARDAKISNLRDSAKLLFDKHDEVVEDLHATKLHVAETYVNREVLKEQLAPVNAALKEIRDELRDERRNP